LLTILLSQRNIWGRDAARFTTDSFQQPLDGVCNVPAARVNQGIEQPSRMQRLDILLVNLE
jgi:hypothetical protein